MEVVEQTEKKPQINNISAANSINNISTTTPLTVCHDKLDIEILPVIYEIIRG